MTITKYKFTSKEYHLMAEAGIFSPDHHLELIKGEIVGMSPIGRKHASAIARLQSWLHKNLDLQAIIWTQTSVRLSNGSEPQPDLALLKRRDDFYEDGLPTPADILLIIEVADSSISYDRDVKMPLYAEFDIAQAWLIDVNEKTLTKYTEPSPKGYKTSQRVELPESISCLGINLPLTDIFGN